MKREIVWTKTARQSFVNLLVSIQDDWGDEKALAFAEKVEKVIVSISERPLLYPRSFHFEDSDIRKCVLSKQTSLYYRVSDSRVTLLTFFANRRNLDDLTDLLSDDPS